MTVPTNRMVRLGIVTACLVFGLWYACWTRGTVLATLDAGVVILRIRQIPVGPPGQNSEYAYRCEVWRKGVLFKATTQLADSFIANPKRCSITIKNPQQAVFDVDGYLIVCDHFNVDGDTLTNTIWKRDDK